MHHDALPPWTGLLAAILCVLARGLDAQDDNGFSTDYDCGRIKFTLRCNGGAPAWMVQYRTDSPHLMAAFLDITRSPASPTTVTADLFDTYDAARAALTAGDAFDASLSVENYWRYRTYRGCETVPPFEEKSDGPFFDLDTYRISQYNERLDVTFRCIYKKQSGFGTCPGGFRFGLASQRVTTLLTPPPADALAKCDETPVPPPLVTPSPLVLPDGYEDVPDGDDSGAWMANYTVSRPPQALRYTVPEDALYVDGAKQNLRCTCVVGEAVPPPTVSAAAGFIPAGLEVAFECIATDRFRFSTPGVPQYGEVHLALAPDMSCTCPQAPDATPCDSHDVVSATFVLDIALAGAGRPWEGEVHRYVRVDPSRAQASLTVVGNPRAAEIPSDQDFVLDVRVCRERYVVQHDPELNPLHLLTVASDELGLRRSVITARASRFVRADTLRLTFPPIASYVNNSAARVLQGSPGVEFSFAVARVMSRMFVSGILPQVTDGILRSAGPVLPPPDAACLSVVDCNMRGACERFRCLCSAGWVGDRCERAAGTDAHPRAANMTALDVALAGALLSPASTVATLQHVYVVGRMSCAGHTADYTARLRYAVQPLMLGLTDDDRINALWGTVVLSLTASLLHAAIVGLCYYNSSPAHKMWSRILARVYAPNVNILLLHLFTTPLLAGAVHAPFSAATVVAAAWSVGWAAGYALLLLWLRSYRLRPELNYVEFLTFPRAMQGAPLDGAQAQSQGLPAALLRVLPAGYWSSRHLLDRGFLQKFALAFWDYGPHAAQWLPLLSYARTIVTVVVMASADDPTCRRSLIAVCALDMLYFLACLWARPYTSLGSNVLNLTAHLVYVVLLFAALLGWPPVAFMNILGAVLLLSAVWTACTYVFLYRVHKHEREVELPRNEDIVLPIRISGWLCITEQQHCGDVSVAGGLEGRQGSTEELVPRRSHDSQLQVRNLRLWCEVRGSTLFCFEKPGQWLAEMQRMTLSLTELVPVAACEEAEETCTKFSLANEGRTVFYHFAPESDHDAWYTHLSSSAQRALAPQQPLALEDRMSDYSFDSQTDVIVTTTGHYRMCRRRDGAYPADSSYPAPGDTTGQPLLMHVVEKSLLSAAQQTTFIAELAVLTKLRCDFLVCVSDGFENEDTFCRVVPYIPGGGLVNYVAAAGAFSETDAAFYAGEVLLALEHLHANRLVFRNLAPSDVLFDYHGHVLLADPGIPVAAVSEHKMAYTAPEVFLHEPATAKSDVWALGGIVYYMLHNLLPYRAASKAALTRLVLNTSPQLAGHVSASLRSALHALMAHSTELRPCATLSRDLKWFSDQGLLWESLERKAVQPPLSRRAEKARRSFRASPRTARASVAASTPSPSCAPTATDEPVNPLRMVFSPSREVAATTSTVTLDIPD